MEQRGPGCWLGEHFIKCLGKEEGKDHTKAYLRQKPQRHGQLLQSQCRRGLTDVPGDTGDHSKSSSKERWRWETERSETPSWITQTDRGISFQDGITSAPDDSHVGLQKRTITVRLAKTEDLNPGRVFLLFLLMMVFKF